MLHITASYLSLEPGDHTHYNFYIIPLGPLTVAVTGSLVGYVEHDINICKAIVKEHPTLLRPQEYEYEEVHALVKKISENKYLKCNPWTYLASMIAVYEWDQQR